MSRKETGDGDIETMDEAGLRSELLRLRGMIRQHRDARGDDRCWIDDEKLYAALPEGVRGDTAMDAELMLPNCRRFLATRVNPCDRFAWGDIAGGGMLAILEQAERELPSLLLRGDDWQSLYVNDELPHVERLWMPYGEGRLMLHRIHPCEKGQSLYHPHGWPSAVRIREGYYETGYGDGPPDGPPPPQGRARVLGPGDCYEMVSPNAWHFVRPLGEPSLSVMVTGRPWPTSAAKVRRGRDLGPLSPGAFEELHSVFQALYPSSNR